MGAFSPTGKYEDFLFAARAWPNFIGRSAGRKIARRCRATCVDDFMARVAKLGPGQSALDLGANVGFYTQILAKTGAEVHAFEPDPDTFEILQENLKSYDNVTLHQKAVGLQKGKVQLFREKGYADNPSRHSVGSSVVRCDDRMDTSSSIDVDMVAFDDALALASVPPSVIKMDIEGAENAILEDLFSRPKITGFEALFVETHENLEPELTPLIARFRNAALDLKQPLINLYWP